jgi:hypothetical protein
MWENFRKLLFGVGLMMAVLHQRAVSRTESFRRRVKGKLG